VNKDEIIKRQAKQIKGLEELAKIANKLITEQEEQIDIFQSYLIGIIAVRGGEITVSADDVEAAIEGRGDARFKQHCIDGTQVFRVEYKDH